MTQIEPLPIKTTKEAVQSAATLLRLCGTGLVSCDQDRMQAASLLEQLLAEREELSRLLRLARHLITNAAPNSFLYLHAPDGCGSGEGRACSILSEISEQLKKTEQETKQ